MDDAAREAAEERLMELLLAGMDYQRLGWHVFALGPDKVPLRNCGTAECRNHALPSEMRACRCLTCHGAYAATLDGEKLARQLEAAGPEAQLGLATGAISGVFVVDLDPKPDRPIFQLLGQLAPLLRRGDRVVTTTSPRHGLHLFFAQPDGLKIQNSTGNLAPGIDVRGEGGYVVLPPSTGRTWKLEGELTEAPPKLLAALQRPRGQVGGDPEKARRERGPEADPESSRGNLRALAAFVERSPGGERNTSLHWAACRAREEVLARIYDAEEAEAKLLAAAVNAGLPEREAHRTLNRILNGRDL